MLLLSRFEAWCGGSDHHALGSAGVCHTPGSSSYWQKETSGAEVGGRLHENHPNTVGKLSETKMN